MTAPAAGDGIRSRVLSGLVWKGTSQVVLQASRAVVAIILARLLAPHDFGLAGMVLVFSSLVLVLSDLAVGAALVQRPALSEEDRSTAFWLSLGAGTLFTLLGVAASGPIAQFYGEPAVRGLFAALSLSFVVTSLGTTQAALLTRDMNFRNLELCPMLASLVGAAVGIVVAVKGYGAWAIIAQQVTNATVTTALLWLASPWRPRFTFSRASLRDFGGFSANVFGQRLLYYLHRNVDNLLVGRFLGAAALGAYSIAYNVMLTPFSRIAGPIQEVLFPAFSRMQDDPRRLTAVWVRVTRVVGAVSMPALLGLMVVAPDFVHVVLGPRWSAAAPVLQILVWVGLLQSLQTLNGDILVALDRTGTLFRYSIVFFCVHVTAFAVGLHWGIVGVAAGYAVTTTLVEPLYTWVTARALGVRLRELVRGLAGVAQASVAMVACVLAARLVLVHEGAGPLVRLGLCVLVGAVVYVPACALRAPEVLAEVRGLRRKTPPEAEAPPLPLLTPERAV